jgi:hypothetical protein
MRMGDEDVSNPFTKSDTVNTIHNSVMSRGVIPFTGGLLFVVYAFFWPEAYGRWLGTIVHAFRAASGI